jgi:hypothetical protein
MHGYTPYYKRRVVREKDTIARTHPTVHPMWNCDPLRDRLRRVMAVALASTSAVLVTFVAGLPIFFTGLVQRNTMEAVLTETKVHLHTLFVRGIWSGSWHAWW